MQRKTLDMVDAANEIIEPNMAEGYTMTLRQLHYQFVQLNIYKNTKQNYERLGYVLDQGRRAGLIDWSAIEDRGRSLIRIENYPDPKTFMDKVRQWYAEDLWRHQNVYIEFWVEKEALSGVIERPCNHYRVPYFACKGYPSSSELYLAGRRFRRQLNKGKDCTIFYLGDHDPAGLDMTRNVEVQVNAFARAYGDIKVVRLALNMDQIQRLGLAPNAALSSRDSKTPKYIEDYGTTEVWELDALSPAQIDRLIRDAIVGIIPDMEAYERDLAAETLNRKILENIKDKWEAVARYFLRRDTPVFTEMGYIAAENILMQADDEAPPVIVDDHEPDYEDDNGEEDDYDEDGI